MPQLSLTLITVTKDDPTGLERTLSSANGLRQAGAAQIVVCGDSQTYDGAAKISSRGDGVRVLDRPPSGVADAFNAGVAEASSDWVWFLNGGDQIDQRLDLHFLWALLSVTKADVVIGALTYEGEGLERRHPAPVNRWPSLAPWIPHPASIVRRRLFERLGGFDVRYQIAMDYEWWLRVQSQEVAIDVVDVPFAVFAPGGLSQQPERRVRLNRERDDIIRRHHVMIWRNQVRSLLRVIKFMVRALVARRL